MQAELEPIRARRKEYEKDIAAVYDILNNIEYRGVAEHSANNNANSFFFC